MKQMKKVAPSLQAETHEHKSESAVDNSEFEREMTMVYIMLKGEFSPDKTEGVKKGVSKSEPILPTAEKLDGIKLNEAEMLQIETGIAMLPKNIEPFAYSAKREKIDVAEVSDFPIDAEKISIEPKESQCKLPESKEFSKIETSAATETLEVAEGYEVNIYSPMLTTSEEPIIFEDVDSQCDAAIKAFKLCALVRAEKTDSIEGATNLRHTVHQLKEPLKIIDHHHLGVQNTVNITDKIALPTLTINADRLERDYSITKDDVGFKPNVVNIIPACVSISPVSKKNYTITRPDVVQIPEMTLEGVSESSNLTEQIKGSEDTKIYKIELDDKKSDVDVTPQIVDLSEAYSCKAKIHNIESDTISAFDAVSIKICSAEVINFDPAEKKVSVIEPTRINVHSIGNNSFSSVAANNITGKYVFKAVTAPTVETKLPSIVLDRRFNTDEIVRTQKTDFSELPILSNLSYIVKTAIEVDRSVAGIAKDPIFSSNIHSVNFKELSKYSFEVYSILPEISRIEQLANQSYCREKLHIDISDANTHNNSFDLKAFEEHSIVAIAIFEPGTSVDEFEFPHSQGIRINVSYADCTTPNTDILRTDCIQVNVSTPTTFLQQTSFMDAVNDNLVPVGLNLFDIDRIKEEADALIEQFCQM